MTAAQTAKPGVHLDPDASRLLAKVPAPRPILFLDRDGVINVDEGYVHRPEDTRWIPGIFELCERAGHAGMLVAVVTNQAGIARGYYSEAQFLEYTRWMHAQFSARGVPLLATLYCPHHPEAKVDELRRTCDCRKPAPGMIRAAAHLFDIDLAASVLVGNRESDVQAGEAGGVGLNLLFDAHDDEPGRGNAATCIVHDLAEIRLLAAIPRGRDAAGSTRCS